MSLKVLQQFFNKSVIVCFTTVMFAMLVYASYDILKPPPMKQAPTQVPIHNCIITTL